MNIALWVVQILLGLVFVAGGLMKATQPKEKLAPNMPWVNDFSAGTVKFIGVAEFLGGVGLIAPWATGIATILTPLAATGLVLTMLLAAIYHLRKDPKEYQPIAINVVLLALAAFVAIGRF